MERNAEKIENENLQVLLSNAKRRNMAFILSALVRLYVYSEL